MAELRSQWRRDKKQLATLNGSFDLLHAGHLEILYAAAAQGDILLVAINSDVSVKSYKGPTRPIIPLNFRMELLTALSCVDYVTWFDEADPRALLALLQPDVHVNGEEYGENCIESTVVREGGGRLHLVPRIEGLATSDIIRTIRALP